MSVQVRPGQVWVSKATGTRWEVLNLPEFADRRGWWPLLRLDEHGEKALPEWKLAEDYVLEVKP